VYEVLIERTAERDLESLPTKLFDRIVPRIKAPSVPGPISQLRSRSDSRLLPRASRLG
jgi:hypothetical protein